MKKTMFQCCILLLLGFSASSQNFISTANIEFEVKTNVKKTMGNSSWAEMLKDQMPQFKTGYFNYTFANNQSMYKFDRWEAGAKVPEFLSRSDEENSWFFDFNANKFMMKKVIEGTEFIVDDSIPKIEWKLSNESRVIAGFNCRKAVGVIMDSVYVFAFYTDEIMIPGGPCSINGLPGMILGVTIPRLYTSFIATKIMVTDVKTAVIKPINSKKYFTNNTLKSTLFERSKDWGSEDDDEDSRSWINQFKWNALL